MRTRQHDGLEFSEIGIGCYALSGAYGKINIKEFKAVLRRAHDLGVNFYDTADTYRNAEEILGETVKPFREDVLIATKVGVKKGPRPNLDAEYLRAACEDSLRALDTDYIDLYQIHFDDPETPVEETTAALDGLQAQGKIRRYGLGHIDPARAETYLNEGNPFSILMEFSPLAGDSYRELHPLCHKHQAGIIAFSTTGRGLLTGKFTEPPAFESGDIRRLDPLFQRERFQFGLQVMGKLAEIGERRGKTPAQTAIAWVLAQEGVICALTGPSTIPHLEENLGGSGWQLTSQEMEEINKFIHEKELQANRKAHENMEHILSQPLPEDPQRAFTDLIYAIETAIRLGQVQEPDVMPIFYELFNLRKELDDTARQKMGTIQRRLRELT